MKVVLASRNIGKITEFKTILAKYDIEVLSLSDIGFEKEIVEDGSTFMENALIKAKTIYDFIKLPVIADDSGLCCDALGGAPGIYSARYIEGSDDDRILYLLKQMEDKSNRNAHFHCSIVFYMKDGEYKHFFGDCYGKIAYKPSGENGFGYDPIFLYEDKEISFGLLSREEKNKVSHRAIATKKFLRFIENDFNNK